MKIIFSSNSAWNLLNFRKPVITAFVAAGHSVMAVAPADGHERALEELGARFRPIAMRGAATSPVDDARLLAAYHAMFRAERPDLYLGFTSKPNIYGSIAARMTGVPTIATISGLGSAFLGGGLVEQVLLRAYRFALGHAQAVMFQNPSDRDLFLARRIVRSDQARLVAGSGVDLDHFRYTPLKARDDVSFLLIGRLLLDKGVAEFVEAASIVRDAFPQTRFQLLGGSGGDNPSAVARSDIDRWTKGAVVELLGAQPDVRPAIAVADCIVLPSYREGLPRSLLEGAAMGRPLVASDVPGCRDVVEDSVNGYLCQVKSAQSLAAAMMRITALSPAERAAMGAAGRRRVERDFDQRLVANAYLREIGI